MKRIQIIDAARGLALIAMAIFHCAWDLSLFGYMDQSALQGGWTVFARIIASSFLFIVGMSIVLSGGFEGKSFLKRWLQVALAAAIISIVTFIAIRQSFIFFGILHLIAVSMLIGGMILTAPWYLLAMASVFVFFANDHITTELFDAPLAAFVGLSDIQINSVDFVPLFPWFSAVLLGMATAKLLVELDYIVELERFSHPTLTPFARLGRYSLIFYLVHQPILIAMIFTLSQFWPPA